jgi:hypothetical protein
MESNWGHANKGGTSEYWFCCMKKIEAALTEKVEFRISGFAWRVGTMSGIGKKLPNLYGGGGMYPNNRNQLGRPSRSLLLFCVLFWFFFGFFLSLFSVHCIVDNHTIVSQHASLWAKLQISQSKCSCRLFLKNCTFSLSSVIITIL